jgi:Methyltransferase domain
VWPVQQDPTPTDMLNRPAGTPEGQIQMLRDADWQMSFGERAALEGLLSQLQPQLAIEIGTAEGGSLARVAAHSAEVHSFDLVEPQPAARELPNVTFHTGDSHKLLPELLARLDDEGRNVDFVLVDGDHSADGVRQDVEDLLASPAVRRTIIVLHDTMNETVRAGLESVRYETHPKVAYVELDLVAGYMFREPSLLHELWGGLGLVVVDSTRDAYFSEPARQRKYYEAFELVRSARELVVDEERGTTQEHELERLREELGETRAWLDSVQGSFSWRITAPLRAIKRSLVHLVTGR